ncbi:putative phosphoesterase, ICC [Halodesulfurarchaeum formicicum]|uniref:Putative phosphoesterase, ICC n=1 Tax=Halodesulfurarchaeum formicicum TaxID=1873524 RepID=A0A1D8S4D4_9EURY|nr:metallophosphoesterase [Halodesulfurarchaeum formicicum]AOW80195.1 putative phosphoesterase, ICC [Halodesulfurarchaeum formicicum]APE95496.1 putative phosphoesterase, ICC [Halodesulfurarchaeum formicicum]
MDPFQDVVVTNRAVSLPSQDTLVLADLHLGRVRSSRVELPLGEQADLMDRIDGLLETYQPSEVVVAGDLIHSFDTLSITVQDAVDTLTRTVTTTGATLTVTTGNHDGLLDHHDSIDPVPAAQFGDTVVLHGHERPTIDADRYIIGHEHPAIRIEGVRHPCTLACPDQLDGAAVLVLPAFSRVASGTIVNGQTAADTMSPLLTGLDRCRPIVSTADGPLEFPPLGELRPHL